MHTVLDWFVTATLPDYMGLIGFIGYISAYFLLQVGLLKTSGYTYSVLNLVASGSILVSLQRDFNPYSTSIEITWCIISVIGIARVFYLQKFVRFSPVEARALTILAPSLTKSKARKLLKIATRTSIAEGTLLATEGEKVDNLTVLLDGHCSVMKRNVEVAILRAGAIVGEMTYATGAPATATVVAKEVCDTYVLSAERLRALLTADPHIALELELASAAAMRQRLRETTDQVAARLQPD
jgi:hypothetical protein